MLLIRKPILSCVRAAALVIVLTSVVTATAAFGQDGGFSPDGDGQKRAELYVDALQWGSVDRAMFMLDGQGTCWAPSSAADGGSRAAAGQNTFLLKKGVPDTLRLVPIEAINPDDGTVSLGWNIWGNGAVSINGSFATYNNPVSGAEGNIGISTYTVCASDDVAALDIFAPDRLRAGSTITATTNAPEEQVSWSLARVAPNDDSVLVSIDQHGVITVDERSGSGAITVHAEYPGVCCNSSCAVAADVEIDILGNANPMPPFPADPTSGPGGPDGPGSPPDSPFPPEALPPNNPDDDPPPCEHCPGEVCEPGSANAELQSVDLTFSLGMLPNGKSAGRLYIQAEDMTPALATPAALRYDGASTEVEVIKWANCWLRQVMAPQVFVDIVMTDETKYDLPDYRYEIRFYAPQDAGVKGALGLYEPTGAPFVVWTVANPDAANNTYERLRFTKTVGTDQIAHEYAYTNNAWTLLTGNGLQSEVKQTTTTTTGRIVTRTKRDASGTVIAKNTTTYTTFPWGDNIVQQVIDPDHAALTTTVTYYEDPADPGYGQPQSVTYATGARIEYAYNADGTLHVYRQTWQDTQNARVTLLDYAPVDPADDGSTRPRSARTLTQQINGITVAKTYRAYVDDTEITEYCATPTAAYGDPQNQRATVTYHGSGAPDVARGKLQQTTAPDGRSVSYAYEQGTLTIGSQPDGTTYAFTPDPNGSARRETVTHGPATTGKTTRSISVYDAAGNRVLSETQAYTGSRYARLNWTVSAYNQQGQAEHTWHSDGTASEALWGCCGKTYEKDRQGTEYDLFYDDLQRLQQRMTRGVGTQPDLTVTYDRDGLQQGQTTTAGSLSQSFTQVYNTARRLVSSTDTANLTVTYAYANAGRAITVTRPGNATEISDSYIDGRLKSVTGSGVIPRTYAYGVNANGTQWTTVYTGSAGTASPVWATTTYDWLGRPIQEERPGYDGATLTTTMFYNADSQLVRTTSTGQPDTLYAYDGLGNLIRSGQDVNANSALDDGVDRIAVSDSSYQQEGGDWWQVSVSGAPGETGVSKTRVTGLGASGADGILTAETVSVDVFGNQTASRTYTNRATQTVTRVTDDPLSTTDAVSVTVNGLLASSGTTTGLTYTYAYDDLGRRTGVTDPRTGTALTHYNANGQMDWTEDAAGNRTAYAYDPDTGRRSAVTDALLKTTHYEYDLLGRLTKVYGDNVYPVDYGYDEYGRKTSMTTYRDGTGDTTTWVYEAATGLLLQKVYADSNATTYTYTPDGKLLTRAWARGVTTTYAYDPATGDLAQIAYSDATPTVTLTGYDSQGRPHSITDGAGTRSLTYGPGSQLTSETLTGLTSATITHSYTNGRPTGVSLGSGYSVTYGYDTVGRFQTVAADVAGTATQTYTYSYLPDADLLQQVTSNSGLTVMRAYEPQRDVLTSVDNALNGTLVSRYAYVSDELARRASQAMTGAAFAASGDPAFGYGYNNRSEVTAAQRALNATPTDPASPPAFDSAYAYDLIGNRTQATHWDAPAAASQTIAYTTNAVNQYTQQVSNGSSIPIFPDIIASFGFEEGLGNSTADESGNNYTANISGATWVSTGKIGSALYFDGQNDFLSGNYPKLADNFTLVVWVKATATHQIDAETTSGAGGIGGQTYLFFPEYEATGAGVGVSVGTNGISVYEHSTSYMPALAVYQGALGTWWNHVAITYTNRQPRIYLNGKLVRTGLVSSKNPVFSQQNIGGSYYGYFQGLVDEVKMFARPLSDNEILSLYSAYPSEPPIAEYHFSEGPGNTTTVDSSANGYDATLSGATWTTDSKAGYALGFDGNDAVLTPYPKYTNNFTLAAWVKAAAAHEIDPETTNSISGTAGQTYLFFPDYEQTGAGMGVSVGTNGISVYEHSAGYMPPLAVYAGALGTGWNHVAVTYTDRQPRIYLNGQLVRTGLVSPKNPVYLEQNLGGSYYGYFRGVVDEVQVFDRPLTAAEVQELYSAAPGSATTTTTTPVYDPDGNLLDDGRFQYAWDAEHRLVSAEPLDPTSGLKKVTFTRDALGRRVRTQVYVYAASSWTLEQETTFVYDGWNVIQATTTTASGTETDFYVWGLDLSGSIHGAGGVGGVLSTTDALTGTTRLYTFDANGNVGQLVNAADGAIAAHYEYDAFGNTLVASGPEAATNPIRFSTKWYLPELGWYDYGMRPYAPELGRWPSRDPLEEEGGLNLYGFVGNNPLTFVDPVGFSAEDGSWQQQLLKDLKQSLLNAYWGQVNALWDEFSSNATLVDPTHGLISPLILPIFEQLMHDVAEFEAGVLFPCLEADTTSRDYQVGYYGTVLVMFLMSINSGGGVDDVADEIGSQGIRNVEPLTDIQRTKIMKYAKELGLDPSDIEIAYGQSRYSEMMDLVIIGPDSYPLSGHKAKNAFERLSPRSAIAHEAGHMITTRAGTDFAGGTLLDEFQATIVGRTLPGLSSTERYTMLRMAVELARKKGADVRNLINQLKHLK